MCMIEKRRGIYGELRLYWAVFVATMGVTAVVGLGSRPEFEAVFNFGDSNSDTGGFFAAFPSQSGPWGMTFFKKPTGRASDGRLVIDFLGLRILPEPDVFGESLYTFNIGQNDFTYNLGIGVEEVKSYIPKVVNQIVYTIKEIYGIGGRTFLVQNLAPVGCYPSILVNLQNNGTDIDRYGCLVEVNKAVVYYNNVLKKSLSQTRTQLTNATIIYLDTHKVLLELFRHPKSHGFQHGIRACCGNGINKYNYDNHLYCGNSKLINGVLVTAEPCSDPQNYVSYDGIHATEAANRIIAMTIINGSISTPPFALKPTLNFTIRS